MRTFILVVLVHLYGKVELAHGVARIDIRKYKLETTIGNLKVESQSLFVEDVSLGQLSDLLLLVGFEGFDSCRCD